ncbi:hypothetical protein FH965_24250 [Streptomyces spectabilis]|uniref:Uncharacterized protein n=1 Tax=Streptomyces spectabilis TaxID=68270 RepID=A0A516RCC5_STRST|nr:hypothetical protein [Streptomyces spectabilis]QDQ13298.1 hypothetical protein FH965_24250 [Streptomyces spectabilis]
MHHHGYVWSGEKAQFDHEGIRRPAERLGEQLAEYARRFASDQDRDSVRLAVRSVSAVDRLRQGRDVSLGFYLRQSQFLSLALVTCPNAA